MDAPDEAKTKEPAIKHFDIRKEDRNRLLMRRFGVDRVVSSVPATSAFTLPVQPVDATLGAAGNKITMTACQTLAQSLSASPTATSYPTTKFSLPPSYHHEISDLSAYNRSFPLR